MTQPSKENVKGKKLLPDDPEKLSLVRYIRFIASVCTMTIGSTYIVYSFLKTEFVTAEQFNSRATVSAAKLAGIEDKLDALGRTSKLAALSLRYKYLEDRVFELELTQHDFVSSKAIIQRYQREQVQVKEEINNLQLAIEGKGSR